MNSLILAKLKVGLVALALCIGSCTAAPPRPATTPVPDGEKAAANGHPRETGAPPSRPSPAVGRDVGDGVQVASDWVDALARSDVDALTRKTSFPFRVHHAGADRNCGRQSGAATPEELPSVIACLTSDASLISVLQKHSGGGFDALAHGDVQPWARQWQAELQPDWRLVTAYFERGDATVELNLVVANDGVRALWKADGLDATVEAQLATEWLSALRSGNGPALDRLSQYPFELRDRGRSATCGIRPAARPDDLNPALQCLTSNTVFLKAMRDSSELAPVVYRSVDQLPGWARAWWDQKGAPTIKVVSFLMATTTGDEFDLLLLVDKSGVHALWKSGSFESTD
jgi:hypothetical protein